MTTTTLMLAGMFAPPSAVTPRLRGDLTTVGKTLPNRLSRIGFGPVTEVAGVRYLNWLLLPPWDGRNKIDQALHNTDGQVIVLTHSMGSFAAWLWLQDKAPTSDVDPDRVVFVTMGAAMSMKTKPYITESRYRTIDVTVQWDRYADEPNVRDSPHYRDAVLNVKKGDSIWGQNLHVKGYLPLDLDAPDRENRIGNATYLFYETADIPLAGVTREQIESAYERDYLVLQ